MKHSRRLALILVLALLVGTFACGITASADTAKAANGELLDAALIMVAGAQNKAEEIGVPMVISVMDMDGNLVLMHRMEGSLLASMDISQNKAFTAVALKMPSADVKKLAQEGEELQGIAVREAGKIVEFGGGLPIYDKDGKQIGGIGVSGGSVAEDTSVAQAGLDAYAAGKAIDKVASGGKLLDLAIKAAEAAGKRAEEINVPMVISVVDMGGNLVLLHRMENSLLASLEISPNKAFTAAALKMPTANVKDLAIEGAELQGIAVQHAGRLVEFGGGLPLYVDGVQIGAMGVSGGSVDEDTNVVTAGLEAINALK